MADSGEWTSPPGDVVIERHWKYAPPPHVMFDAIVDDHERWMTPELGRAVPQIVTAHLREAVIIQPWIGPVTAVEIRITPDGPGTKLTVLAYSARSELS